MRLAPFLAMTGLALVPEPVAAHAFGESYRLPIPLWLFLYAGAAVVVVSFLVVAYFVSHGDEASSSERNRERIVATASPTVVRRLRAVAGLGSAALLFVLAVGGIVGSQEPFRNVVPVFVWVVVALGITYITALIGNIWDLVNPWRGIVEAFENLTGRPVAGRRPYPTPLAYYPALLFFLGFILMEFSLFGASPRSLGWAILVYSGLTIAGMISFGKEDWLRHAEFFTVFYGLVARLAPLRYAYDGTARARPPLVGALRNAAPWSLVLFILLMLASTAFDGVRQAVPGQTILFQVLGPLRAYEWQAFTLADAFLLFSLWGLFTLLYVGALTVVNPLIGRRLVVGRLVSRFAFSLLPIALVYNMAHYWTLLVVEGPRLITLASDPFGVGWDLFGTAGPLSSETYVGAAVVWYSQVVLIVVGHTAAVYLAHRVALTEFGAQKEAVRSQYPMMFLMVLYTLIGLWILAQVVTTTN